MLRTLTHGEMVFTQGIWSRLQDCAPLYSPPHPSRPVTFTSGATTETHFQRGGGVKVRGGHKESRSVDVFLLIARKLKWCCHKIVALFVDEMYIW